MADEVGVEFFFFLKHCLVVALGSVGARGKDGELDDFAFASFIEFLEYFADVFELFLCFLNALCGEDAVLIFLGLERIFLVRQVSDHMVVEGPVDRLEFLMILFKAQ